MTQLPKFKIRCSAIHRIMGGSVGLTEDQEKSLKDYISRENGTHPKGLELTDKMAKAMTYLIHKRDFPDLPDGAKTYCKEWLKQTLYGRKEQVKTKGIEKGHDTEEDGFTAMCVQLGLGMVYKNEDFKSDDFMMGTCDLDHEKNDTVYDNKSSWSLDQFPMFETEIPNTGYRDQIQGYMHLWGRKNGAVVYTLNNIGLDQLGLLMKPWLSDNEKRDIALNLIYTLDAWEAARQRFFPNAEVCQFVEIPESERVKAFNFKYDADFIKDVQQRVIMCRDYIKTLVA